MHTSAKYTGVVNQSLFFFHFQEESSRKKKNRVSNFGILSTNISKRDWMLVNDSNF